MVVTCGVAPAVLEAAHRRPRRKSAWPGFVLFFAGVLAGGVALAIWRFEAADRATYVLATRQCGAAREEAAGSAAAEFWCRRARQLRASLGTAAAEGSVAGPVPAGPEGRPPADAADGPTARELAAARTAAMWGRLDGR